MKILVTGGDNSLSGNIHGEADPAARFFADHGIAATPRCEPGRGELARIKAELERLVPGAPPDERPGDAQ